jgi:hypothetical protein
MKRVAIFIVFCLLQVTVFSLGGNAQSEKYKIVLDSISAKYMAMKECHIKIQSKISVSGHEVVSQAYDLYKRNDEFYVFNNGMEMLFTSSVVLMVIPDQKQIVVRPVTDKELKALKNMDVPQIDSAYKNKYEKQFSETDRYYLFTNYFDKGEIVRAIYSYNKSTFLMEKVEYFYKDMDDNKDQKSVITYVYASLPPSKNYFNTDKYLTKTKTGYVAAAAYSNYIINVNDPYEK